MFAQKLRTFLLGNLKNYYVLNPSFIDNIKDKLEENIHEMWATLKIESGWAYYEVICSVLHKHVII